MLLIVKENIVLINSAKNTGTLPFVFTQTENLMIDLI